MDKLKAAFLGRKIRRDMFYEDIVISGTFIIREVGIYGTEAVDFSSGSDHGFIFCDGDNIGNMLLALLNGDTVTIRENPEKSNYRETLTLLPS